MYPCSSVSALKLLPKKHSREFYLQAKRDGSTLFLQVRRTLGAFNVLLISIEFNSYFSWTKKKNCFPLSESTSHSSYVQRFERSDFLISSFVENSSRTTALINNIEIQRTLYRWCIIARIPFDPLYRWPQPSFQRLLSPRLTSLLTHFAPLDVDRVDCRRCKEAALETVSK